jgi:hypothetical protein
MAATIRDAFLPMVPVPFVPEQLKQEERSFHFDNLLKGKGIILFSQRRS